MEVKGLDHTHGTIVPNNRDIEVSGAQILTLKLLAAIDDALVQMCLVELLHHSSNVVKNS
jgi:hypothetical protein